MSGMQDVFTKAIDTTPTDQQDTLREDMTYLRNSWEQLNIDLNSVMAQLKVQTFFVSYGESHVICSLP
jgi:nesprin-1